MSVRTYVKTILLAALIVLGLGGLLLHLRIHPVSQNPSNLVAVICGVLGVVLVPTLFCFRKTIHYGYVLNGFIVIVGTIVMAHYSIVRRPTPVTLKTIVLGTTLADILILWGKFFVGKATLRPGVLRLRCDPPEEGYHVPLSASGVVADPFRAGRPGLLSRPSVMEAGMTQFRMFTIHWWMLHLVALALFFYLGHAVRF